MQNIFIEGIQGMGKSTLLQAIAEMRPDLHVCREGDYSPVELAWCTWMTEAQYRTIWKKYQGIRKEIEDNTFREAEHFIVTYTKILTDIPGFHKDLEQYEIYNGRKSLAELEQIVRMRYRNFSGEGYVSECAFLQNIVEELILFQMLGDETKIRGGIGICGRPLCCHTYLAEFAPVSIKMAKEQNLSLNPTKISGVCGRLMCCLTNEEETYEELNSHLPGNGDRVTTPEGLKGDVQSVNVLRQLVKVIVTLDNDEKEIREYKASELRFKSRRRKKDAKLSKEELEELKRLEEKTGDSRLDDN